MARAHREIKLTPVDSLSPRPPVIRLESRETLERAKALGLDRDGQVSLRLHVPTRDEVEVRSNEPDASLSGRTGPSIDDAWEAEDFDGMGFPWGWLVLVIFLFAGFALWSSSQTDEVAATTDQILEVTRSTLGKEAAADLEARELIDRIEAASLSYLAATDPASLTMLSRYPERVAPLITSYYEGKPIPDNRAIRTLELEPLTLDREANLWRHTVEMGNRKTCELILEVSTSGEPKVDWESLVVHQPMPWDDFAQQRPSTTGMDFRVHLESDHLFSHEFADTSRWNCFRLTVPDSVETLFGYVETGSALSEELHKALEQGEKQKTEVILRLSRPTGLQSHRGVIIEKLVSPHWFHVIPPDA